MENRLLIFEKNEEESPEDYTSIREEIDSLNIVLSHRGYQVSSATELSQLTDELYCSQDCILAHPTMQKFPRLMDLHKKYPAVGLIIITGPGKDAEDFQQAGTDSDGLHFLLKPITADTLLEAIRETTVQAKGLAQKVF